MAMMRGSLRVGEEISSNIVILASALWACSSALISAMSSSISTQDLNFFRAEKNQEDVYF